MPRSFAGWSALHREASADRTNDLTTAVAHLQAALRSDPHMVPAWHRLANRQLLLGDNEGATASLLRLTQLDPRDPGPYWQLAALHRARRDKDAELDALLNYLMRYPSDFSILLETIDRLPDTLARAPYFSRLSVIADQLSLTDGSAGPDGIPLLLDISELLESYGRFRLPTGMQRVIAGVVRPLLAAGEAAVCRFDGVGWRTAQTHVVLSLLALSEEGGPVDDGIWRRALAEVHLSFSATPRVRFARDTVLISLFAPVSDAFLDQVGKARRQGGRYVALIYDFIPLIHSGWADAEEKFARWLARLPSVADGYVAISTHTKEDLVRLAADNGIAIAEDSVTVMPLDADSRSRAIKESIVDPRARWNLPTREYVLFVSSIDPRKNHILAYRAWQLLIEQLGVEGVPTLVCVGGQGWKNEKVHALLRSDAVLASRTRMLSAVGDGDLIALYRHARFTLFPSLYEGWGLPVTESFCYGRPAVVARNTSLVEAGGAFADFFISDDAASCARVAKRLITDDEELRARERALEHFKPRQWIDLATDMKQAADRARDTKPVVI